MEEIASFTAEDVRGHRCTREGQSGQISVARDRSRVRLSGSGETLHRPMQIYHAPTTVGAHTQSGREFAQALQALCKLFEYIRVRDAHAMADDHFTHCHFDYSESKTNLNEND